MTDQTSSSEILLARQAIVDKRQQVQAYELLFRSSDGAAPGESNRPIGDAADQATAIVLTNTFEEAGADQVLGNKRAFVNFTRGLLMHPPPLDRARVVLEVLEDVAIDDALIEQLADLRRKKFTIALDDFVFHNGDEALVGQADIVKVDVLNRDPDELSDQVAALSQFGVKLLAERVEDHAMFRRCIDLGFVLFQGYYFAKPEIVEGKRVPANRQAVFNLLASLQDPTADYIQIGAIVATDSVLSFRLLKLVNSAALHRGEPIESLQKAVALLGTDQVRRWASLLALSQLGDKPQVIANLTLIRSIALEALAEQMGAPEPSLYFTVGLLSTLDAFFDQALPELVEQIPVSDAVKAAVTEFEGTGGFLLRCIIRHERGQWNDIDFTALAGLGIDAAGLDAAYRQGLAFANVAESTMA